ncbi:MAG: hypothetical protein LBQ43_00325 [Holosporales bacterium]|jgi:TPR repeat protein|nr:hypothetical protein [Holosporales bacterium]
MMKKLNIPRSSNMTGHNLESCKRLPFSKAPNISERGGLRPCSSAICLVLSCLLTGIANAQDIVAVQDQNPQDVQQEVAEDNNINIEIDTTIAANCFWKMYEKKNAAVQYELGNHFRREFSNKGDVAAAHFFKLAADQEHTEAQMEYGLCLLNGRGVNINAAEAVKYLKAAADKGNAYAQEDYAYCLERGIGVTVNLNLAKDYYAKAAAQEFPYSIRAHRRVFDRIEALKKKAKEDLQAAQSDETNIGCEVW